MTDPARWFEALGVRYFPGRQLSSPRVATRTSELLIEKENTDDGSLSLRLPAQFWLAVGHRVRSRAPARASSLKNGSLGPHPSGYPPFSRLEWWVVMKPSRSSCRRTAKNPYMRPTCAFRRSRPLIPTDRDQLFRLIATRAARVLRAPLDDGGDVSLLCVGQAPREAVPVVNRRDPRATRSALTADAAARAGGPC